MLFLFPLGGDQDGTKGKGGPVIRLTSSYFIVLQLLADGERGRPWVQYDSGVGLTKQTWKF